MRAGPSGVHDSLGDSLVVEMGDLLPEDEVLEKCRTTEASPQRVLIVGHRDPEVGGEDSPTRIHPDPVE